jgi:hypothetical protein
LALCSSRTWLQIGICQTSNGAIDGAMSGHMADDGYEEDD